MAHQRISVNYFFEDSKSPVSNDQTAPACLGQVSTIGWVLQPSRSCKSVHADPLSPHFAKMRCCVSDTHAHARTSCWIAKQPTTPAAAAEPHRGRSPLAAGFTCGLDAGERKCRSVGRPVLTSFPTRCVPPSTRTFCRQNTRPDCRGHAFFRLWE